MKLKVVIYARYSSHSQTEQSIEGQLKVCHEYAEQNGFIIVGQYIDEALTGTNDNRPEFQRMIADSKKGFFEAVLVYKLDRFSRELGDSTQYEKKLKKNGVFLISATERFENTPTGRFMKNITFANNQYYSEELGEKIKRGLSINADKCEYTGGGKAFGYKKAPDGNRLIPDENTAPYVRRIYEMYAAGKTVTQINRYLNDMGIKTAYGKEFTKSSLAGILSNKRYIGIYTFKGTEKPCEEMRIIPDDLFYKVQAIKAKNKAAPARKRAREEYLLTPRLVCGYCGEMMIGYGGTSGSSGKYYSYYNCKGTKEGKCGKKKISKEYIENLVVDKCREVLTDKTIDEIAKEVVKTDKQESKYLKLTTLKKKKEKLEKAQENLFKALELGQVTEEILKRIQQNSKELTDIEVEIQQEERNMVTLTESQVKAFFKGLKNTARQKNKAGEKLLVNVLVNQIRLYDDRITYIFNAGEHTMEITEELIADIEANSPSSPEESSIIDGLAPPNGNYPNTTITEQWVRIVFLLPPKE